MENAEADRLEQRANYVEDPILAGEMREHAAQLRTDTLRFPIYKSRDATDTRVYATQVRPGVWQFITMEGRTTTRVVELSGDAARDELSRYAVLESLSFGRYFGGSPSR
ncbi:hypothetical protein [Streptomyces sp. NRRL S-378]|uniref:hypothetical protein n=1 Tax=Streptomyces sp. NRRL S-378 TaxID=1463904 RepID=UPI0004C52915|nr:hypothetical protein [Streptomyces sp. NRRL S-378]